MSHPYNDLPEASFWRKAVTPKPWRDISFFPKSKFRISAEAKIATAGSCFAQNIARYLRQRGSAVYCSEQAHPLLPDQLAQKMNYGQFSARYGNVYTVRQMLELVEQALGLRPPVLDFETQNGRTYDLLRPSIQQDGFHNEAEAHADRLYHLERVRLLLETADVFVFTLGLTEAWQNARDGYTYPACPGTVAGTWQPDRHIFVNYTHAQVSADLRRLIGILHQVNPALRIILTVSPVHLVATHEDQHVLLASTYSKSVLRAAAGEVAAESGFVEYFPAYEIILSAASFGQYLDADLRDVTARGVSHVMDVFFGGFFGSGTAQTPLMPAPEAAGPSTETAIDFARQLTGAECDEMMNDPGRQRDH